MIPKPDSPLTIGDVAGVDGDDCGNGGCFISFSSTPVRRLLLLVRAFSGEADRGVVRPEHTKTKM